ncbi:MAG: type II toxin-antitoxin system VapC family toxin [Gaiellaceae bacterium]
MTVYVDSSALLKLYIEEDSSSDAREILLISSQWVTAMHTLVEVRRALTRILDGYALSEAKNRFTEHWQRMEVVELDEATCERAAEFAERTGVRTLDALHLGAADRVGGGALALATFDTRQAEAARSLGWSVLGA